jgi:4-diphosphocytidyl-2-C-methyl-D-erythritol kinase
MTFSARPPAKVNLTLTVAGRGPDGYHPLRSVFLRIGLSDRLTVSETSTGRDRLEVGGLPGAPVDGNLVLSALSMLRDRLVVALPPLLVELEKRIPVAAGLAGGSSDGAAMIELASACWGIGLAPAQRLALAAELGSDVPFFSSGSGVALLEGRGERVTPLPEVGGEPGVLLVTPPVTLSTTAVFKCHDQQVDDRGAGPAESVTQELTELLRAGLDADGLCDFAHRLRDANDLWPAAVQVAPSVARLRDRLEARSGRPWMMTGSGSSLFTLYPSVGAAAEAGIGLARERAPELADVMLHATDLNGPDPAWRHP